MSTITIEQLLEELDGAGLVITDDYEIQKELERLGLDYQVEIQQNFDTESTD